MQRAIIRYVASAVQAACPRRGGSGGGNLCGNRLDFSGFGDLIDAAQPPRASPRCESENSPSENYNPMPKCFIQIQVVKRGGGRIRLIGKR